MAWGGGQFNGNMSTQIPGTYIDLKVIPTNTAIIGERGYVAVPMELPWGVDGEVFTVTADEYATKCKKIFGYAPGSPELINVDELFKNATVVHFYRLNCHGEKAKGVYGEAVNGGELGNQITVVIENNPDYVEGIHNPQAEFVEITPGSSWRIEYDDLGDYQMLVGVYGPNGETPVEETLYEVVENDWDLEITLKVNELKGGKYVIKAKTNKDDLVLATQEVDIEYKPQATITEEIANSKYKVTFTELGEYTKLVQVQTRDDSVDVVASKYEKQEDATTVTITVKDDKLEDGNYKIVAKSSKNGSELDSQLFVIAHSPEATITETYANEEYAVKFSNFGAFTPKVYVGKSEDSVDVGEGKYHVSGTGADRKVLIDWSLEAGEYKVIARTNKDGTDLDTKTFTVPTKPTATISTNTPNQNYTVNYSDIGEYTPKTVIKNEQGDIEANSGQYSTSGTESCTVDCSSLTTGTYTLEARAVTGSYEHVLATEQITK